MLRREWTTTPTLRDWNYVKALRIYRGSYLKEVEHTPSLLCAILQSSLTAIYFHFAIGTSCHCYWHHNMWLLGSSFNRGRSWMHERMQPRVTSGVRFWSVMFLHIPQELIWAVYVGGVVIGVVCVIHWVFQRRNCLPVSPLTSFFCLEHIVFIIDKWHNLIIVPA